LELEPFFRTAFTFIGIYPASDDTLIIISPNSVGDVINSFDTYCPEFIFKIDFTFSKPSFSMASFISWRPETMFAESSGEMIPHLELEQKPWWGQDPDYWYKIDPNRGSLLYGKPVYNELPGISKFLAQKIASLAKAEAIQLFWESWEATGICTVCGLRPQGPSKKAADRNVCDVCEKRRADRSKTWVISQSDKTIWTDEVADANGRLALIVGHFDLTHWLDGSMLNSLLLIAPHDPENTEGQPVTSKTASFSRLRRIWETTRRFWQEAQGEIEQLLTDDRRRLKICLDSEPNLGPFHVYDLVLGATDLSMVWVSSQNGNAGYLLSADNLGYIARQIGVKPEIYSAPATAAIGPTS
jgi:hypothetical protein